MNKENLRKIIEQYKTRYFELHVPPNEEIFKWKAVQCFQDEWFAPENQQLPFSKLFTKAVKESSVLINNRITHPANGIEKMAEEEPIEVRRLFEEVLFAEDNGDLELRQKNIDAFMSGIESVRQKHFPACWKYEQNRNAVSCYLALHSPEKNYIYKFTPVENFAKYIEYGKDIGSGNDFNLTNYYEMCDLIAEELRLHPDLLSVHESFLPNGYYRDDSLHITVFDLIYCASTYNLFAGLTHKSKKESIKAYMQEKLRQEEIEKRQAKIEEIESKIQDLDLQLDTYRSINLVGVTVHDKNYGEGIVIWQDINNIKVRFGENVKPYKIHKQYIWRPKFEDDAEIVAAMTEYELKSAEKEALCKQLEKVLHY